MSIQDVTALIKEKLEEDAEWGNSIVWGNLNSFQNDYAETDLPISCVHLLNSSMTESSTQSDYKVWDFSIKGVFWVGEKITTLDNFLEYQRLESSLTIIYNNIMDNLDCAWPSDDLRTDFESIDERMTVTGSFSIVINTVR